MEIGIEHLDQITIFSLSGTLDTHTALDVREELLDLIDNGHYRILVDMAGVTFVDSTGLATLVSGMKRCRHRGGDLGLVQLQQRVRIIFELTRLDAAFEIYPDREAALAGFGA